MYPGVEKLAKLIKIMARDVSKESSWWKHEHVGVPLGLLATDEFFHEISVTDDGGYRDITIGDTRGNVSNGRKIPKEAHRGYMLLYSENSTNIKGKERWNYRCFPDEKEIARRLQNVIDKVPVCGSFEGEVWYDRKDSAAMDYYSFVVRIYADKIHQNKHSAKEIFAFFR